MNKVVLIREFEVDGIHTEQLGSKNQPWDAKVSAAVFEAFVHYEIDTDFEWFEVETLWHVYVRHYPRDVDNFRLKPVLDAVTRTGKLWKDDRFPIVRKVRRDAVQVGAPLDERVVVRIYGVCTGERHQPCCPLLLGDAESRQRSSCCYAPECVGRDAMKCRPYFRRR